jgi:PAS domain S-box-containing protein
MTDIVTIPREELARLQERARRLALEKSYLQLVNNLMNRLSTVPGLENTVQTILRIILDNIGGTNVSIYYLIDSEIHYADVYGEKAILQASDDHMVCRVFENKEFVEEVREFGDTKMMTPEFTKASYWAFPLMVGERMIGVLKMEGMLMAAAEVRSQLQPFFDYAALVLKNEIESYSKLTDAYERLRSTNEALTKEMDERLKQQHFLEALLESTEAGIVACDANGVLTLFNRKTRELHGLPQKPIPADEWAGHYDLYLPDGKTPMHREHVPLFRTLQGERVTNEEMMIIPRGGEPKTLLASGQLITDKEGQTVGAVVAMHDITERKNAEDALRQAKAELEVRVAERTAELLKTNKQLEFELAERMRVEVALRESETKYRRIVDTATEGIWALGPDGRTTFVNARMAEILDYRREDFVGRPLTDFMFEEDALDHHGRMTARSHGASEHYERRFRSKGGQTIWTLVSAAPVFDDEHCFLGSIAMVSDITDRKQMEQELIVREREYRTLLESVPDLIVRYDLDLRRVYVNPAWERASGLSAAQVIGVPYTDIPNVPSPFVAAYVEKLREVLETGASQTTEFIWVNARGVRLFLEYLIVPEYDQHGEIAGVLAVGRDITERKRAEEERLASLQFIESMDQINQAIQGASELDQMMSEVLGVVLTVFDCDRAFLLYPCDPDTPSWRVPMERTRPEYPGVCATGIEMPMDAEVAATFQILLESSGAANFGPESEYPLPTEVAERFGFKSLLSMALYPKMSKPWQFGIHQCSHPRVWTREEMRLFQEIGRRMSDALTSLLAARNLKESEERLRLTLEATQIGIWDWDMKNDRWYASPMYYTMLGYEPVGGPADRSVWLERLHPEDRASVNEKIQNVLTRDFREYQYEARMLHADGTYRWVHVSGFGIQRGEDQRASRMLGIRMDITERKRAEETLHKANETLRATLDAAPVAIFDLDLDGRIRDIWNSAAERVLGWRRDEVLGQFLPSVPEAGKEEFARFRELIRSGKSITGKDLVRCRKDGSRIEYSLYAAPEYDVGGKISGNIAVIVDITERKAAEEEIRKLNLELEQRVRDRTAQLEAANQELEAFAYSVSHDLRAPLRHIDGFLDLLQKRTAAVLDERSQHYMTTISDATWRMGALIDDLLSFSRMGRYEMSKMRVDLGALVQEVIRELEPEARGRTIRWHLADLPAVIGDRAMLRVVLVNLIANAVKFTRPRDQAEIEIGCKPSRGTETVIFIRDNGVGFDMNYADKLFSVFQRLHRAEEFEGTGIGLANVRRIINRHGGRTWAEGKIDHGATFFFSLP